MRAARGSDETPKLVVLVAAASRPMSKQTLDLVASGGCSLTFRSASRTQLRGEGLPGARHLLGISLGGRQEGVEITR